MENILELQELVGALKNVCRKIIQFGSCAAGADDSNSDIDVFILADDPEKVYTIIDQHRDVFSHKLQTIVANSIEWIGTEEDDPVFAAEVRKGTVLWEAGDEEI